MEKACGRQSGWVVFLSGGTLPLSVVVKQGNPFLTYLESHPGADSEALKQLFRILAKRTHPDTAGAEDREFIRLQESYHEAIAALLKRQTPLPSGHTTGESAGVTRAGRRAGGSNEAWRPTTPRERVLHYLYRYKAHLIAGTLEPRPLPSFCVEALDRSIAAAADYDPEVRATLVEFREQFDERRATLARYPDVRTKYALFFKGLANFFDYMNLPSEIARRGVRRLVLSYLEGLHPVTDYDPTTSPHWRTNRSAPARAVLYRMRRFLEDELDKGPCRIV
jgi:hypothetical protein